MNHSNATPKKPNLTIDRNARRREISMAQSAIKRFAAKLPAAQGVASGDQQLTEEQLAAVLFLDDLRTARRAQHLTQKELAQKTGLAQSVIARLEAGKANPTLQTLLKIAAALGVQLALTPSNR